jgi:hypothetical protein
MAGWWKTARRTNWSRDVIGGSRAAVVLLLTSALSISPARLRRSHDVATLKIGAPRSWRELDPTP